MASFVWISNSVASTDLACAFHQILLRISRGERGDPQTFHQRFQCHRRLPGVYAGCLCGQVGHMNKATTHAGTGQCMLHAVEQAFLDDGQP